MLTVRRRTAVVNLTDGTTLVGQRRLSWPWQIKLTGARLHRGRGVDAEPVDGVVLVPRRQVQFLQVVT